MDSQYEQTYKDIDFTDDFIVQEYESCAFSNCNFESIHLDESKFIDCTFEECNFTSAQLHTTALRNIVFINCKMIGIHFDDCNAFGLEIKFLGCKLDYCIYSEMDLRKLSFEQCSMIEVDFSSSNLSNTKLTNCNLERATFNNTNLSNADIRGSFGFQINPSNNKVSKMHVSISEIEGLLSQFDLKIDSSQSISIS